MSLRKALRTPQICKNGGLQILAEFCDKAAVPRQHTPCGNKKPDPWENKITEKFNFVFHGPHLLQQPIYFFDFGDQKTKLSFFAILFSQLAFLGSQIWDRNGIDWGRCSSPRSAQSCNRNSLSVSLVDLGGKRSHEDPPPRRSWREKEQEHRPLRHQMQVRFRGVARWESHSALIII